MGVDNIKHIFFLTLSHRLLRHIDFSDQINFMETYAAPFCMPELF